MDILNLKKEVDIISYLYDYYCTYHNLDDFIDICNKLISRIHYEEVSIDEKRN